MRFSLLPQTLILSLAIVFGLSLTCEAVEAAKPILIVRGKLNASYGTAQFDRGALERLGLVSFETSTPWNDGKVKFEGVPLRRLMETVQASGSIVQALALNDYSTEIPAEDFERYNVVLAIKRNGEYMPVRDKGPLWIVYPYDSDPELKSQKYYSRSAWQVKELVVK